MLKYDKEGNLEFGATVSGVVFAHKQRPSPKTGRILAEAFDVLFSHIKRYMGVIAKHRNMKKICIYACFEAIKKMDETKFKHGSNKELGHFTDIILKCMEKEYRRKRDFERCENEYSSYLT